MMKNFKRILALVTIVTIVAMSSMISTFAVGTLNAYADADTVKAGETVTIAIEMSSLADAQASEVHVVFDNTAFVLPEGNNTAHNFGNMFAPVYYPNYVAPAFVNRVAAAKAGGMDLPLSVWPNVSYNATENETIMTMANTSGNTVITADFETMLAGPYNIGHFCFVAKDDIAPGEYEFDVTVTLSTTAGRKDFASTVTVEVEGDEFTPETIKGAVVEGEDDIILEKDPANKNFNNKYLGTAVFKATLGATVKYGEAGFIWVKDGEETANKYTVDASVIAGGGTFAYGVAMYGIPEGVDIDAIPYYVTAE